MMLLQIALQDHDATIHGLDRIQTDDEESHKAIKDFGDACVIRLALESDEDSPAAIVRIIKGWEPQPLG